MNKPPVVWAIAASDSSGGAGIQADLKTLSDLGVSACTVVTAITAQNRQGVQSVFALPLAQVQAQVDSLLADGEPDWIKMGVLPNADMANWLFDTLGHLPIVLDPVIRPTAGKALADHTMIRCLREHLGRINVITPNRSEAEQLTGRTIDQAESQWAVARALQAQGSLSVLLKGGHVNESKGAYCQDLLLNQAGESYWLSQPRQTHQHTHGTGCTLASALTGYLVQGKELMDATVLANAYVQQAIERAGQRFGHDATPGGVVQAGTPSDFRYFPSLRRTSESTQPLHFAASERSSLGLYPVVDTLEWVKRMVDEGVPTLQLRIKSLSGPALIDTLSQAIRYAKGTETGLYINDYWSEAIELGAYGVHLGQEDLQTANLAAIAQAGLRLGVSTHSEYEWCLAATIKPSYIALGAVFPTDTKEVIEIGLDNLKRWVYLLKPHYPLVAIGGINLGNIRSVLATGVGSVAVVSAITQAQNYQQATAQLAQAIDKAATTITSECYD